MLIQRTEGAVQRCSYEKVFWKYAANLQENTHTMFSCNFATYFQNTFS